MVQEWVFVWVEDTVARRGAGFEDFGVGKQREIATITVSSRSQNLRLDLLLTHVQDILTRDKALDQEVSIFLKSTPHSIQAGLG